MQCPFCKETIQEGAIKCKHCGSILNSSSQANQPTPAGQQQNMQNQPGKFNWYAFFFNAAYYAGYGKVGKGIVLSIIGFIPLTMLCVGIYTGRNANRELSVGMSDFSWARAIGVAMFGVLITLIALSVIKH